MEEAIIAGEETTGTAIKALETRDQGTPAGGTRTLSLPEHRGTPTIKTRPGQECRTTTWVGLESEWGQVIQAGGILIPSLLEPRGIPMTRTPTSQEFRTTEEVLEEAMEEVTTTTMDAEDFDVIVST